MAKMKLSESTFTLIPEGVTIFKVMEVDDSKYEDFGKLAVKLQTAKGETHTENFTLTKQNGELNEGALKAWSYFARTCLNNFQADEIDTQDIVGCYIQATVKHETYTRTKGEKAGQEATAVRLNDYTTAVGFAGNKPENEAESDSGDEDDLDDFLND
ncbi:hypothetical protein H6A64_06665 [Lacrimispora saccharolytica]|nr:hypothetical protein [Lacrimispora saccharolytica]